MPEHSALAYRQVTEELLDDLRELAVQLDNHDDPMAASLVHRLTVRYQTRLGDV